VSGHGHVAVELSFDEMAITRALQNAVAYGATQGLGDAIGQAIGQSILDRLATSGAPTRDQLAAMAVQGMLADESGGEGERYRPDRLAGRAYEIADAMLAARGEPTHG
jgi:hypothetical protein